MGVRIPGPRSGRPGWAAGSGAGEPSGSGARPVLHPGGRLRRRGRTVGWQRFPPGTRRPGRAGLGRSCRPGQDFWRVEPQHPAERPERAAQRYRCCGEEYRHLGVLQQGFELPAKLHRVRHQRQQPAAFSEQRVRRRTGLADRGRAWRGGGAAARGVGAGFDAGGEPGKTLLGVADAAHDQRDQRRGEPEGAARHHGLAEPPENVGEALGRGGGWGRDGHGVS